MNGYAKMHPVGLEVRADMLESVWGYSADDLPRELAFAMATLDQNDPESCRWLATLLTRRVGQLSDES